jgi:hypothetical protein
MDFFQEIHVFLQHTSRDLLEGKEAIHTLKHRNCKKLSIETLTQYSQGNNVLDHPASQTDGFLREIHLFLHFSRRGLFGAKQAFLFLENYDLQEVFLSTSNSILLGKQCATAAFSNRECFLWRGACVSSTQLNRPMLSNKTLSPPGNT